MADVKPDKQTLQYLTLLVIVCTVTVGLVTLIDFRIKGDILKAANRVHDDLTKIKALMGTADATEDDGRVPERIDIPVDTHGSITGLVARDHVDSNDAGMEAGEDNPPGRASFVAPGTPATNGKARARRTNVPPRDKPVGS